ncbi:hypothetical protein L596_026809 [Steinernema carpocapsae]|uniref:Uncharacterized protein n=1 Tax=Steinernema carpocapsae TaxID=34508 RepID=A0A4U5M2I1_STECR|nr:hypothetical protein L596_026809 [Steinernema carpocapsae]
MAPSKTEMASVWRRQLRLVCSSLVLPQFGRVDCFIPYRKEMAIMRLESALAPSCLRGGSMFMSQKRA